MQSPEKRLQFDEDDAPVPYFDELKDDLDMSLEEEEDDNDFMMIEEETDMKAYEATLLS